MAREDLKVRIAERIWYKLSSTVGVRIFSAPEAYYGFVLARILNAAREQEKFRWPLHVTIRGIDPMVNKVPLTEDIDLVVRDDDVYKLMWFRPVNWLTSRLRGLLRTELIPIPTSWFKNKKERK